MSSNKRKISTRLVVKGALIEDTYTAFRVWDLSLSLKDNLNRIRQNNLIGASNASWLQEILKTLSSRFVDGEKLKSLVILAQGEVAIETWKACLLWYIGSIDELYYRFAVDWLFNRFREGTYYINSADVVPFVREVTDGRIASGGNLSEYGAIRAARDLLRMATDFGILEGHVKKRFVNFHLSQDAFLFILHGLFEETKSNAKVVTSKSWRLFLMNAEDVERELLRLHQFNQLEYQAAGSIVDLKLPCDSLTQYARKLVA